MQNLVDFTCSAFVINESRTKTAIHLHKKTSIWMQPGGHIDPGEFPYEAAVREAKEELGLDTILDKKYHSLDEQLASNDQIQPNPIATYKQQIAQYKSVPAHFHSDSWFILIADESQAFGGEENQSKRMTKQEILDLSAEESFQALKDMAQMILRDN